MKQKYEKSLFHQRLSRPEKMLLFVAALHQFPFFLSKNEERKKRRRNKRLLEAFVRRGGENYRESGETAKKCTEMGKLVSSCAAKLLTGKHEGFCFCPLIIKLGVGF